MTGDLGGPDAGLPALGGPRGRLGGRRNRDGRHRLDGVRRRVDGGRHHDDRGGIDVRDRRRAGGVRVGRGEAIDELRGALARGGASVDVGRRRRRKVWTRGGRRVRRQGARPELAGAGERLCVTASALRGRDGRGIALERRPQGGSVPRRGRRAVARRDARIAGVRARRARPVSGEGRRGGARRLGQRSVHERTTRRVRMRSAGRRRGRARRRGDRGAWDERVRVRALGCRAPARARAGGSVGDPATREPRDPRAREARGISAVGSAHGAAREARHRSVQPRAAGGSCDRAVGGAEDRATCRARGLAGRARDRATHNAVDVTTGKARSRATRRARELTTGRARSRVPRNALDATTGKARGLATGGGARALARSGKRVGGARRRDLEAGGADERGELGGRHERRGGRDPRRLGPLHLLVLGLGPPTRCRRPRARAPASRRTQLGPARAARVRAFERPRDRSPRGPRPSRVSRCSWFAPSKPVTGRARRHPARSFRAATSSSATRSRCRCSACPSATAFSSQRSNRRSSTRASVMASRAAASSERAMT